MATHQVESVLGVDLTTTSTSKVFTLGRELKASDGNVYVYCTASGSISAYAACVLDESGVIAALTTTLAGVIPSTVVFPQVAFAASEYGWAVKRGPSFSVLALSSAQADVKIYSTATGGAVDDTSAGGTKLVQGLRLNASNGASTAATNASAEDGAFCNFQD